MKATGIVRAIDNLGRIVIPTELRKTLQINDKDPLEIYVDDDCIILKKYRPFCIFCGEGKDLTNYRGYNVCPKCIQRLCARAEEDRQ